MSDGPEETKWEGFTRKLKKQIKTPSDTRNWRDVLRDGLLEGYYGHYDEAINEFDHILDNTFENVHKVLRIKVLAHKANALVELGRHDEALLAYDEAIKISNGEVGVLFHNKGALLFDLQRYSEALICFNRSVELEEDADDDEFDHDKAASFSGLAETHIELRTKNDLDLAMQYVEQAIKLDSENGEFYRVKALIHVDELKEEYDKALENIEIALKLDPEDVDSIHLKGVIYLNMEKLDLAEKLFLESLNHDPSDETTHYNLACIYSLLKDKQKAIDHLIVATYLDPSNVSVLDDDESFDNIRDSEEFKRLQSVEV